MLVGPTTYNSFEGLGAGGPGGFAPVAGGGFGMTPTLLAGPNTGNAMGLPAPAVSAGAGFGASVLDAITSYGGVALSAVGAVSQAIGAYYSAKSQRSSLKHQAALGEVNAKLSELGARSALLQGQRQEQASKLQYAQLKSRQRVAMAANGIDVGAGGTAQRLLDSTEMLSEWDAIEIQRNALQAAWGHRMQATNARGAAAMASAGASGISPGGAAATSLIGSAAPIARQWYEYNTLRM